MFSPTAKIKPRKVNVGFIKSIAFLIKAIENKYPAIEKLTR